MEITRLAGLVIIIGFIIFWVGNLYSPPGLYQETDLDARLLLVSHYPTRWTLSQGLGGAGVALIALGLIILSIDLAADYGPWLTYLPAALTIFSVGLLALYLYQYITDPLATWSGSGQPLLTAAVILTLASGILFGTLFLRLGLPAWLGYLTIGFSAVAVLAMAIARPPSFYVLSIYFLILFVAGIALLRYQGVLLINAV